MQANARANRARRVCPAIEAIKDVGQVLRRNAVSIVRNGNDHIRFTTHQPAPCWFVLWRMEEEPQLAEAPVARPVAVSLSYHDAGRWLDAQETVEQVSAPADVVEWMRAFAQAHYTPEPKRRQRPQSFLPLTDRFGNPASVSTGEKRKGAGRDHG